MSKLSVFLSIHLLQEKDLRHLFFTLITPFGIRCHSQLLFLLEKVHRNEMEFEVDGKKYNLTLSADKKNLTFSDCESGKKVAVCWWSADGCCLQGTNGRNQYLLCATHAKSYARKVDESRASLAFGERKLYIYKWLSGLSSNRKSLTVYCFF